MWKNLLVFQQLPDRSLLQNRKMGGQLRAQTVPEGKVSISKFDFKEMFDCEPFMEMTEVYISDNGKLIRNEGTPNAAWLEEHNLAMFSPPEK